MIDYALIASVIGFPAGVLPVTKVMPNEQGYMDHFNDRWTMALNNDSQSSVDMPIAVQLIGYAFEDEKLLGIMSKLNEKLDHKIPMPPIIQSDLGLG